MSAPPDPPVVHQPCLEYFASGRRCWLRQGHDGPHGGKEEADPPAVPADLLASCKELREALAGAMRVIVMEEGLTEKFVAEMASRGIPDGIGERAESAIRRAGAAPVVLQSHVSVVERAESAIRAGAPNADLLRALVEVIHQSTGGAAPVVGIAHQPEKEETASRVDVSAHVPPAGSTANTADGDAPDLPT